MVPARLQISKVETHLHSSFEKSLIEMTMEYIKDRTSHLMIIFLAKEKKCKLKHIKKMFNLLIGFNNKVMILS